MPISDIVTGLPSYRPYTNITPFTIRDGATYLLQLEALKDWWRDVVVPHIDTEINGLTSDWKELTEKLQADWETKMGELILLVDDAVAGIDNKVELAEAAKVAAEAARDLAEQYASQAEEVQDTAITGIMNDTDSNTRQFLDGRYATFTSVEGALSSIVALDGRVDTIETELEGRLSEDTLTTFVNDLFGEAKKPLIANYNSISALMADTSPVGSKIAINGFVNFDDVMFMTYRVDATLPSDRVLSRISVPMANGRWAVPLFDKLHFDSNYDFLAAVEMEKVARTYVDAGADLIYDSSRHSPLTAPQPVHQMYSKPYPITCSSFGNLVMMGIPYELSTYVANANNRKYLWGTKYPLKEFTAGPWQAHKMLEYWVREGKAVYYRPGQTDLKPGDMIFYCKQDPEGAGSGGSYFFNAYHNAMYIGNGNLIHAYAPISGNGVVQQAMSATPTNDICFVVRGPFSHEPIHSTVASSLAINATGFVGSGSTWYANDQFILIFDGVTTNSIITAGTRTVTAAIPYRPLTTFSQTIHTSTGQIIRVRLNTDRTISFTTFENIPSGATLYGSITAPVFVP